MTKSLSYTWHQNVNSYISSNCLDLLNQKSIDAMVFTLNDAVCIKVILGP